MKKISFLLFFILSFSFISSASSENLNDYSPDFLCEALMIKDCKIDFYSFTPQYDRYLKSNWQHKIIVLNQNSMSRQFEDPLFYFVTEQRDAHAAGWGYHEERTTLNNCKSKIKDDEDCVVVVKANKIINADFIRQILSFRQAIEETSSNDNVSLSAREKLKELKYLLDEGLISQDQYEEKATKILENY